MKRLLVLLPVLGFLAVPACGGDDGGGGGGGGGGAVADAECPLGAIEEAGGGPVEIVFWHSMTRANEESLTRLTEAFNSSQDDVRVTLVNQSTYEDTIQKYRAGLGTGDVPDIVQIDYPDLQQMIDSQSVVPAQACVEADDYDLSDHLDRVVDAYTAEDTLWAMPFNVSNPVLYYDKAAFRQAGLDPEDPPATLDEVREDSEALKESGYPAGFALKIDAFFFEQYFGKADALYANNQNGRAERATDAAFDTDTGRELFTWFSEMVEADLAVTNPRTGSEAINNYLAIGNKEAGMTVDSTAALGTIDQVLGSGQFAGVELGVAPMPGPDDGGVLVGGAALYIVNKSSPEEQEAAWRFAKFLNEPEQVATWAADTGYIPTRESAVDLPAVQQRWAEIPGFRVAYDQLLEGDETPATAGAVIGDYRAVRKALEDEEVRMFTDGKDPEDALADAKSAADDAIQEYNERVGA